MFAEPHARTFLLTGGIRRRHFVPLLVVFVVTRDIYAGCAEVGETAAPPTNSREQLAIRPLIRGARYCSGNGIRGAGGRDTGAVSQRSDWSLHVMKDKNAVC